MSEEAIQWKPCGECGAATRYEPVGIEGLDALVSVQCDVCRQKEADLAAAEERQRQAAAREAVIERMIPPALRRTDIDHPGFNRLAWQEVEKWTPYCGRWLLLLGETGMCKTRMAALLAARAIRRGVWVEWTTAMGFADAARDEASRDMKARREARANLDRWMRCHLLILDDFGKEAGEGRRGMPISAERAYFRLFDHRLLNDLPVILSCNTDPREMLAAGMFTKDRGAPLVGRILEASGEVLHLVPSLKATQQEMPL